MYPEITTNECLPYLSPPLEYEPGTMIDVDRSNVIAGGTFPTCENPELSSDEDGYVGGSRNYRRSDMSGENSRSKPFMQGRLITSSHPGHSALNFYHSGNSLGPDFVAVRGGFYCDMDNKQAYPICVDNPNNAPDDNQKACFDTDTNPIRSPRGIHDRGQLIPRKCIIQLRTGERCLLWSLNSEGGLEGILLFFFGPD